jgi:hypothetical protein
MRKNGYRRPSVTDAFRPAMPHNEGSQYLTAALGGTRESSGQ